MSEIKKLPYGRQTIEADDVEAVLRVLQSDYLTTGPEVPAFEEELAAACEARHAVAACKYPPEGIRSVGPWRASGYYADQWGYVMRANAAVVVIVQCEHIRAVEDAVAHANL